jgi:hypothetical protein
MAQCLSYFHRIEERGSGFRRMRTEMLDHGLDQPSIGTDTGISGDVSGPGEDVGAFGSATRLMVTPLWRHS